MRNKIVITSLEEDFRKIGLIKGPSLTESVDAEDTDTDESDALIEKKKEDEGKARWRVTRRRNYKTGEVQKTKVTTPWKRAYNKKYYKAHRTEILKKMKMKRKSAKGKKQIAMSQKLGIKKGTAKAAIKQVKASKKAATAKKKMKAEEFDAAEALKSFANAAIIAEQIQTSFTEWVEGDLCESVEDAEFFAERVELLGEIAEHFAEIATAIGEADEFSDEDVEEIAECFEAGLHFVLESVELYESNSEDADDDSLDEDVDADDDEDGDDEGND